MFESGALEEALVSYKARMAAGLMIQTRYNIAYVQSMNQLNPDAV